MNGKKVKYWRFDNEIKNRERNKKVIFSIVSLKGEINHIHP